jgi:hypothetical protein
MQRIGTDKEEVADDENRIESTSLKYRKVAPNRKYVGQLALSYQTDSF